LIKAWKSSQRNGRSPKKLVRWMLLVVKEILQFVLCDCYNYNRQVKYAAVHVNAFSSKKYIAIRDCVTVTITTDR